LPCPECSRLAISEDLAKLGQCVIDDLADKPQVEVLNRTSVELMLSKPSINTRLDGDTFWKALKELKDKLNTP
jgi:hypothetical protein